MDMKKTMAMMTTFQRENETLNTKEELMDEMLTDAFDTEDMEEEAEALTGQVLAELGVEMDSTMAGLDAPSSNPAAGQQHAQVDADADVHADLQARLNAL